MARHADQLANQLAVQRPRFGAHHHQVKGIGRQICQRLCLSIGETDQEIARPRPLLGPAFQTLEQTRLLATNQQNMRMAIDRDARQG